MIARAWNRFWFSEGSLLRLAYFRILLMVLCLMDLIAYSGPAFAHARAVSATGSGGQWRPIYLFSVLGIEPMGTEVAQVVYVVAIFAIVLGILGLFTRSACLVAGVLVLYWTAYCYSFDKPHHEKIAMAFALMALPMAPVGARFSIDACLHRMRLARKGLSPELPEFSPDASFPLRLTQLTIVFGYSFAGWTKLAVSGFDWANGYTLMAILLEYDNKLSHTFTSSVLVAQFFSWGSVALQSSFPLVMFFPRLRWFYLPSATLFHLSTWFAMGTAPYVTLWFMLIAFLPLERIPSWLNAGMRSSSWPRKVFCFISVVLPTVGTAWVLFLVLPKGLLVFLILPLWSILLSMTARPKLEVFLPATALKLRAWLRALDWSGRLNLRDAAPGQTELVVQGADSEAKSGRAARVAVLRNLPLTSLLAGFAR